MDAAILKSLIELGGLYPVLIAVLYIHYRSTKLFREELKAERGRNDRNLVAFFQKLDGLKDSWLDARCRLPENALCQIRSDK